ncbi:CAP domain-containing protein [Rhodococcus antarcticus]|uniref:CAP domain-containing protein n=1 Tax=Rhodococcus antarcticus TaxID=2987751 RepID=A0ABY6NYT2_9NOCA|nr:CAP domain-containing protein [Rhodococcus antarcticus]UZJ24552.1 CAP domain-containing protein [Rhodococcus antarcticus]
MLTGLLGLTAGAPALRNPPFRLSGGATDVAWRWSAALAAAGTLSRDPSLGADMDADGPSGWSTVGESVANGGTADVVVDAWMASPPHRANILNLRFTVIGVGSVTGAGKTWSITEFADVADARAPTTTPEGAGPVTTTPLTSAGRLGTVSPSGVLAVKHGRLLSSWTTVGTGVTGYALDGLRLGVINSAGVAAVKEGDVSAPWVLVPSGVSQLAMAATRLAVVTNGTVIAKDGPLTVPWVVLTSADSVTMWGNRIGVLSGRQVLLTEGFSGRRAVLATPGVQALALSDNRVGIVAGSTISVKEGGLDAGWVGVFDGVQLTLSS